MSSKRNHAVDSHRARVDAMRGRLVHKLARLDARMASLELTIARCKRRRDDTRSKLFALDTAPLPFPRRNSSNV